MSLPMKFIEIRDEGTCIACVAFRMTSTDPIAQRFLKREGYPDGGHGVVLMKLYDQKATSDAYEWGGRTMGPIHLHLEQHWDEIKSGQVLDARVIIGERSEPATAEIWQP